MLQIRSDGLSLIGSREVNEDSYVMRKDDRGRFLFVVADGLGGHGRGEVASQTAVQTIAACFDRWGDQPLRDFLCDAMWSAQNEIMRLRRERGEVTGMLTTCVTLVISGDRAMWAHVGDSRLYLVQGEQMKWTKDHSVPQMLVQQNGLPENQIRFHPDRNKILRAMGNEWDKPKFDVSEEFTLTGRTAFLLCTDGFWELIEEKDMLAIYRASDSPEKWLGSMLQVVQQAGVGKNMDNHTAIAVFTQAESVPVNTISPTQEIPRQEIGPTQEIPRQDIGTTQEIPRQELGTTQEIPRQDDAAQSKPKRIGLIVAVIAAAALILAVVLFVVFREDKPTDETQSSTETEYVGIDETTPALPEESTTVRVTEPEEQTEAASTPDEPDVSETQAPPPIPGSRPDVPEAPDQERPQGPGPGGADRPSRPADDPGDPAQDRDVG